MESLGKKVDIHDAFILAMPQTFVPRMELLARDEAREKLDQSRAETVTRVEEMMKILLAGLLKFPSRQG